MTEYMTQTEKALIGNNHLLTLALVKSLIDDIKDKISKNENFSGQQKNFAYYGLIKTRDHICNNVESMKPKVQ